MSGLDVVYNGQVLVKEKTSTNFSDSYSSGNSLSNDVSTVSLISSYEYRFKPSYRIKHVLKEVLQWKQNLH